MLRRTFLAAVPLLARADVRREVFLRAPGKGTAVMAFAFYTKARGVEMRSIEQRWSRSDTIDVAYIRDSADNGRTWSAPRESKTGEKRPTGMLRRHPRGWFPDPRTGRSLEIWNEGILPTDDPLEGLRQWNIYYRVDGGPVQQVVQRGTEYSPTHPLPGIFTGKNCAMLGDMTCTPISAPDGRILLPLELTAAGADGSLFNPGGGYTWTEAAVAHGTWRGGRLEWEMSDVVRGDPATTTRGMVEPTLGLLDDGRVLMVLRGSNDKKPELDGRKWMSVSHDGGWKWSSPVPWTYDDGSSFFSPSACSQLLRHSSGRLYWIGNITPENPKGNRPRYPLCIGEVDRRSGLLRRTSVRIVDTLQPGEDPLLTLSNFYAREDRETRQIVIHATRLFAKPDGWEGDAMVYRSTL